MPTDFQTHNQQQRAYFEDNFKRAMLPSDTPYIQRQVRALIDYAQLTKTERILDVGCGIGRYTLPLARSGYNVEGLDLSPRLIEQLHEFAGPTLKVPTHVADIINHPAELDGQFDAVVGFFALHHLHDIHGCYRAMRRLLKPRGKIIFLEPNAYNPLYYLQIAFTPRMTWQGDGGIIHMRRAVIFDAMREAGFSHLRLNRFGFFPPFLTNRPWGAPLEDVLQSFPLWEALLPFQLFFGEAV